MSNVLIGIIGVILFIGLALAGALFLGPRFQESTNNSRASAAVQAVAQVANAANMYKVQEGKDFAGTATADISNTTTGLVGTYLKSVPSNPTSGTGAGTITLDSIPSGNNIRYVRLALGDNGQSICEAVNRQSGVTGTLTAPAGTQGCITQAAQAGPPAVAAGYVVFAAI
jgi:hypothetical protein